MDDEPLRGPRIKIRRANDQIDEIEREVSALFEGQAYALVIERDPKSGDRLAKIKLSRCIPDSLFLLIPEAIYHLRSTLDQLMVAIARGTGIENCSHIYFPFGETADQIERATQTLKGQKGKMVGIPPDVQKMVVDLRPFKGGNEPLWALSRLSNVDKHTGLVPIGAVNAGILMRNLHVRNAKVGIMLTGESRLDKGITISNLGAHGTITGLDDQAQIIAFGDIVFGDVDVFSGLPVGRTMRQLSELTECIVESFSAHCFGK